MTDLRAMYPGMDRDIRWAVDRMYDDVVEDIFRDWMRMDPRPTVDEMRQMISWHDDRVADAWDSYMDDYEGDDVDYDESPGLVAAVEWLVREYGSTPHDQLYSDIDMERGRHKKANTSNEMILTILFQQDRALAEGWVQWLKENR